MKPIDFAACHVLNLDEHFASVFRFALSLSGNRHVAEELAQESMLRAWESRSQLKNPGATRQWLFQIAVNLWRDELRRRMKRETQVIEEAFPEEMPETMRDAQDVPEQREELQRALDAMNQLPERQRQVLYLRAVEEMTIDEISQVLSISRPAVKSSLSLARKTVRLKTSCQDRRNV